MQRSPPLKALNDFRFLFREFLETCSGDVGFFVGQRHIDELVAVLGLGLLWGYIVLPVPIYGTLAILAIAYVTRYLPIGLRAVSGGMIQIDKELDEASRVAGASWLGAFRYVIAPLLRWLQSWWPRTEHMPTRLLSRGP